jgi:hypothetical protein
MCATREREREREREKEARADEQTSKDEQDFKRRTEGRKSLNNREVTKN